MSVYTPGQMADLLEKLPKAIDRAKVNAVRRGIRRARTVALRDFRSGGVGRTLFGKNGKGARGLVKVNNPKMLANGTVTGGLELKGLAAMTEEGGRTKPHKVHHPGGPIHRRPFAKPAIEHELGRIKEDLENAAQAAIDKLFR